MACKTICSKCCHRWSKGGKLYCTISHLSGVQYSSNKKECPSFKEGRNDKYWRRKDGSHREKGRVW